MSRLGVSLATVSLCGACLWVAIFIISCMSSDPLAMSCDAWRGHLVPKIRALREGSHEIDKSISTSSDHQSSTNESLTIPSITKVGGHIVLGNESKRSHCAEALQQKPVPFKPRTVIEKSIMHPYQISLSKRSIGGGTPIGLG